MDAGDTMLSIPADTPMEQLSPVHIVRARLFLSLIRKHQQLHLPVWNCIYWSVMPFHYGYRWMRWTLKVCLWKNRDFPTDEEECKSIKHEDEPLEPMRIKFGFIEFWWNILHSSYGFNKYTALEVHICSKSTLAHLLLDIMINVLRTKARVALIVQITKDLFFSTDKNIHRHTHPNFASTWWRSCI